MLKTLSGLLVAGAMLVFAPAGHAAAPDPPATLPRAIYTDPADGEAPAAAQAVRLISHGSAVNGLIYHAAGAGPHPVALLLHGLPGNEQNLDLAQAMRRDGWTVVTYHYRGSWGSEGAFSIDHVVEDAAAVLDALRDPANAKAWRIDAGRIVVVGHSLGGFAAARLAAHRHEVMATGLIAPWDPSISREQFLPMTPDERTRAGAARWDLDGRLGPTTSAEVAQSVVDQGERWKLGDSAAGLADRPVLVVTATRDSDASRASRLKAALTTAKAGRLTLAEFNADHGFNNHRIGLEAAVLLWLEALPGAPIP